MGGTKRQQTTSLRSLSSRRDSVSPAPATAGGHNKPKHGNVKTANVGCMSGIFQLMSKYHTHRKFLTFEKKTGRKQERQASSSPSPKNETVTCPTGDPASSTMSSLEVPRSPVIPAEIRSSSTTTSPRVVARLMGLDEVPAGASEEKRRKLLGALEKCDEDLKALKRIIDSVRGTQTPPPAVVVEGWKIDKGGQEEEVEEEDVESEEPSPVSVLDRHHQYLLTRSPPLTSYSKRAWTGQILQQQQHIKQKMTRKKPGEEDHNASFCYQNKPLSTMLTSPQSLYFPTMSRRLLNRSTTATSVRCSAAMKESVNQVCKEVAQGQKREVERLGLLLQDVIYRDLVDEMIKDMSGCFHVTSYSLRSLPFEACKRQLCF